MRRRYENENRPEGDNRKSRKRTQARQTEQNRYQQPQNQYLQMEAADTHCLKQENVPMAYDVSSFNNCFRKKSCHYQTLTFVIRMPIILTVGVNGVDYKSLEA